MTLIADESVDYGIIRRLRQNGISVYSISENYSGITDAEVLKIANEKRCLLITEDKDFGELTYRLKHEHRGIMLIRLNDISRNERIDLVSEIVDKYFNKLGGNFSVLTKSGLRVKTAQVTHHNKLK
jgi:predicted nuclease of predicted toxin-antitoxin system